jgi:hypothetical protein
LRDFSSRKDFTRPTGPVITIDRILLRTVSSGAVFFASEECTLHQHHSIISNGLNYNFAFKTSKSSFLTCSRNKKIKNSRKDEERQANGTASSSPAASALSSPLDHKALIYVYLFLI